MYVLTPHGIEQKAKITTSFLKRKINEYAEIKKQIQEISREIEDADLKNFSIEKDKFK